MMCWINWWLTDCVCWPVAKRRRPVILPGLGSLTGSHQVDKVAQVSLVSHQVSICPNSFSISHRILAPVFSQPGRRSIWTLSHLLMNDVRSYFQATKMFTIGTGGPLGTGGGSLGWGGGDGSHPAPSCSPTWEIRFSRRPKEDLRLFFTSGIEVGWPDPGWNQLRAFPESQGLKREPGKQESCDRLMCFPVWIVWYTSTCLVLVPPNAWRSCLPALLLKCTLLWTNTGGCHWIWRLIWSATKPQPCDCLERGLFGLCLLSM